MRTITTRTHADAPEEFGSAEFRAARLEDGTVVCINDAGDWTVGDGDGPRLSPGEREAIRELAHRLREEGTPGDTAQARWIEERILAF